MALTFLITADDLATDLCHRQRPRFEILAWVACSAHFLDGSCGLCGMVEGHGAEQVVCHVGVRDVVENKIKHAIGPAKTQMAAGDTQVVQLQALKPLTLSATGLAVAGYDYGHAFIALTEMQDITSVNFCSWPHAGFTRSPKQRKRKRHITEVLYGSTCPAISLKHAAIGLKHASTLEPPARGLMNYAAEPRANAPRAAAEQHPGP